MPAAPTLPRARPRTPARTSAPLVRTSTLLVRAAATAIALLATLPGTVAAQAPTVPPLSLPPLETQAPQGALAAAKGFLIVGLGRMPSYPGSADVTATPFVITRFRLPRVELSLEGLDWFADGLSSRIWRAGLTTSFEPDRDATANLRVSGLQPELGFTTAVGAFAGFEMPNELLPEGLASARVSARRAYGGRREGSAITFDVDYFFAATFMWRLGVSASLTLADDAWFDSRFGIDAPATERSGLPAFEADGGVYSSSVSAYTILSLSQNLGLFGRISTARLHGDAADSPLVAEVGKATQKFAGVGLFYLFR